MEEVRYVRLECTLGGSNKFHEQRIFHAPDGTYLLKATWGALGSKGRSTKVRAALAVAPQAACA
jgi:hypothetical protein